MTDANTATLLVWNANGTEMREEFRLPTFPNILDDFDNLPSDLKETVAKLEELSGSQITTLQKIAHNHYIVYDACTADDRHFIIRILNVDTNTELDFSKDKFRRGCDVMNWISSSSKIPIPRIYFYTAEYRTAEQLAPYMITSKCNGKLLANTFGVLPFEAKVANIRSYASIAIELWRINAPSGIGSVSSLDSVSNIPVIGPSILPSELEPPTVNKLNSSNIGYSEQDLDEARRTLKRLEGLVSQHIAYYDAALLRNVPTHEDMYPQNVLVNDRGLITGIIDWEYHMVKPAVLAAAYPYWIRYDGLRNPQSMNRDSLPSAFRFSSPGDATELRKVYEEIVIELDPEYHLALKGGEFCRIAREWLFPGLNDLGCRHLKAWLDSL
ncbi:hypothetical protein CPB84DRAFT_1827482 [Gymnopilus junonius]|uniref:Aminoglycoside phosphotransferase domain-containing protein n=1 Tax=Gymnopilus junonius TaxID=109634 RepID=A0A9P5TIC5_GYMJU|nr:hypothetical protein CPB84DRAFT_1827482 [Gymnopilus junonius]